MSTKPKTRGSANTAKDKPAAKKPEKKPEKKAGGQWAEFKKAAMAKGKAPSLLLLNVEELKPHPLLERITMRPELAGIKDRDWREFAEGEAQSWADFVADVQARGVQDPVHVALVGGEYLILDGRHRCRAAQEAGLLKVPCLLHAEEEARSVVLGSVAQRKKLTQEAVAYLCVMMHPHLALDAKRGRPSEEIRKVAELTRDEARRMAAVSMRTLEEACLTYRSLDEHPAQRRKLEPLILAGAMGLGAARAGVAGGKATVGETRVVKYFANCRTALGKWAVSLASWQDWPEEDRTAALEAVRSSAADWPADVREALAEALAGEGGSV